MTDIELSRALALAIGWSINDECFRYYRWDYGKPIQGDQLEARWSRMREWVRAKGNV